MFFHVFRKGCAILILYIDVNLWIYSILNYFSIFVGLGCAIQIQYDPYVSDVHGEQAQSSIIWKKCSGIRNTINVLVKHLKVIAKYCLNWTFFHGTLYYCV